MPKWFFFLVFCSLVSCLSNEQFIPDYNESYKGTLFPIKYDLLWGYADFYGNTIIEPQFEEASLFQNGLAVVKQNRLYGYISQNGRWWIKPKYKTASLFSWRYDKASDKVGKSQRVLTAIVNDGKGNIYIDSKGKIKDLIVTNKIYNCKPQLPQIHKYSIINSDGSYELTYKYWSIKNDTSGFKVIDTTDLKLDTIIEIRRDKLLLKKDSKYAIYDTNRSGPFDINTRKPHLIPLDSTLNISVNFIYDDLKFEKVLDELRPSGIFKKDGKWGIPGFSTTPIVPFVYNDIKNNSYGGSSYQVEFEEEKYGYISLVFDSLNKSKYILFEHFKR